ncbi:oxidoreductase [Elsinoe ampelina]|uniref:Oxidoreductase n=1 Tax=Elsinoe ampelina TaxID=302913 RepID=A0A6A6GLH7_9PEZI|nr:oxidoreductase [Elsinoe ampelina]
MDVEPCRNRSAIAVLPCLDCSIFDNDSASVRGEFAASLRASLERFGFVKLVGHGISDHLVGELFEWADKLFRMPVAHKEQIAHQPGPNPQRGWSGVGSENAAKLYAALQGLDDQIGKADSREHFDQGCRDDVVFPNRWPEDAHLPGFRPFAESAYLALHKVRNLILKALELAYSLPTGSFTDRCMDSADELRFNHYPAMNVAEMDKGHVSRIWPHTDLGVITCLFQDDVGGLEIEDRASIGSFLPVVRGSAEEMIVSVSETLERWTNGKLKAGVHQVTIPAYLKGTVTGWVPARMSVPYFVKADRNASAGPLPEFLAGGEAPRFDEMTALEYHMHRVATAY